MRIVPKNKPDYSKVTVLNIGSKIRLEDYEGKKIYTKQKWRNAEVKEMYKSFIVLEIEGISGKKFKEDYLISDLAKMKFKVMLN